MEMAILVVLFLVGGITGANQMMKLLERRQRGVRRDPTRGNGRR